jgi:hypothetical protein
MLASFVDEQDEADLRPTIRTGGAAGSTPIRSRRACQPRRQLAAFAGIVSVPAPLLAYE